MPNRAHTLLLGTAIALTVIPGFMVWYRAALERRTAVALASGSSGGRADPIARSRSS
jgi:hypothetical protein